MINNFSWNHFIFEIRQTTDTKAIQKSYNYTQSPQSVLKQFKFQAYILHIALQSSTLITSTLKQSADKTDREN